MIKDVIISVLAAALVVDKLSGVMDLAVREQAGLGIGITAVLIIFCIFLDIAVEKERKRRSRIWQIQQMLERLAGKEADDGKKRGR